MSTFPPLGLLRRTVRRAALPIHCEWTSCTGLRPRTSTACIGRHSPLGALCSPRSESDVATDEVVERELLRFRTAAQGPRTVAAPNCVVDSCCHPPRRPPPPRPDCLYLAARRAMRISVEARHPQAAWEVFYAVTAAGLLPSGTSPLQLESIAREAIAGVAHRGAQRRLLQQLLAAEGNVPHSIPGGTTESAAEQLRRRLSHQERLLECLGLQSTAGGYAVYAAALQAVLLEASPAPSVSLRDTVELWVVRRLSFALLWHPAALGSAAPKHSRRHSVSRDGDLFGVLASSIPLSQRSAVAALAADVGPTAKLLFPDASSLSFAALGALAADLDAVLLRRVVESLLLPPEAHRLVPRHGCAPLPSSGAGPSLSSRSSAAARLAAHLFPAVPYGRRLQLLLRRRRFPHVVLPDAAFLLRHSRQLWRLGRHREIILTHSALLELVHIADGGEPAVEECWWRTSWHAATSSCSPQRFAARRLLCELLARTLPQVAQEEGRRGRSGRSFSYAPPAAPLALRRRRCRGNQGAGNTPSSSARQCGLPERPAAAGATRAATAHQRLVRQLQGRTSRGVGATGGVTVLGLLEELALRRWAARAHHDEEGSVLRPRLDAILAEATPLGAARIESSHDLCEGMRAAGAAHCSAYAAIACGKGLEHLFQLARSGHSMTAPATRCTTGAPACRSDKEPLEVHCLGVREAVDHDDEAIDRLLDGILSNSDRGAPLRTLHHGDHHPPATTRATRGCPAPAATSSHRQQHWARAPVLLALPDAAPRVTAFLLGAELYPPTAGFY